LDIKKSFFSGHLAEDDDSVHEGRPNEEAMRIEGDMHHRNQLSASRVTAVQSAQ
jgi:hypothetical protein